MSIETEITRIKTNIANAYEKAEEKGATLPEVQNSNSLAKTIESITVEEEWKPQPDWWDIEKILEEDTEEYPAKMIYLLDDSENQYTIPLNDYGTSIARAIKIKTSDGAEYYNNGEQLNAEITHIWDTSKDKECSLGYKTRYVIFYWSGQASQDFNIWALSNLDRNVLYIIFDNCSKIRISNYGSYRFGELNILEGIKFKNGCKIIYGQAALSSPTLKYLDCSGLDLSSCNSISFNDSYLLPSTSTENTFNKFISETSSTNYIAPNLFGFNIKLKKITIPENITNSAGSNGMFREATSLEEINGTIPLNGSLAYMCTNCRELKEINFIEVTEGACTRMEHAFEGCLSLRKINDDNTFDFSNCVTYNAAFSSCRTLKSINLLNTNKVTDFASAFNECRNLETVNSSNDNILNTDLCTNLYRTFYNCKNLTNIGFSNTSKVTNFNNTFQLCHSINTINNIDIGNATDITYMFGGCVNLQNLTIYNIKKSGLSFSDCTLLTHDSLINILNALEDYSASSTTYTLTLGATNLAKLTEDEIAIGTNKGWTIS